MADVLVKHCPVVTVRHRIQQTTPWFDADCRAARRRTRAAERRYRRTRCDQDKCAWSDEVMKLRTLYEEKNKNYWKNEIAASDGDMTRLWRVLHGVLGDVSSDDTDQARSQRGGAWVNVPPSWINRNFFAPEFQTPSLPFNWCHMPDVATEALQTSENVQFQR